MLKNFKKTLFFVLVLHELAPCIAQNNIVTIHSSIGDTIDHTEKIKYLLFEEIKNEDHLFSVILVSTQDSSIIHYKRSGLIKLKITQKEIEAIIYNINRLNAYYNSNGEAGNPNFIRTPSSDNSENHNVVKKNLEPNSQEKKLMKSEKGIKTGPSEWEKKHNLNIFPASRPLPPTVPNTPVFIPTPMPSFPR